MGHHDNEYALIGMLAYWTDYDRQIILYHL